jgi:tetratricopeptide (TPR) repeat protein
MCKRLFWVALLINFAFDLSALAQGGQDKPAAAQGEGRGQSVRIRGENGQMVSLYDQSHALVIGVSNYTAGWKSLRGVRNDLIEIDRVLRSQGFAVKSVFDPKHAEMDSAIRDFISDFGMNERNRLLIYFAGHGHTEELRDGRDIGYIVPADAPAPQQNPQQFSRLAISMDDIIAYARKIRSKHALFIFDSCFSGSIFETRSSLRRPAGVESSAAAPVRQFITSGTKNQTVPDESKFRIYFVRAFEQREGDMNQDGYITGEELGFYLAGRVARETLDAQTPRHGKINDGYLNQGDFVFEFPKPDGQKVSENRADAEDSLWSSIAQDNDPQALEVYWSIYCPTGRYCQAALEKLRDWRAKQKAQPAASPPTEQQKEAWKRQQQGEDFRRVGLLDRAIEEFGKAIRLDPTYAYAYFTRGHAYSQIRNFKRAIEDYNEAVRLDPMNKNAFLNRGYAYAETGEHERAIADFSKAILIDPNDFMLFNNRGVAYNNKGEYKKAVADFSEAIRLNPRYITTYQNRAAAYIGLGKKDLAAADESEARRLSGR